MKRELRFENDLEIRKNEIIFKALKPSLKKRAFVNCVLDSDEAFKMKRSTFVNCKFYEKRTMKKMFG